MKRILYFSLFFFGCSFLFGQSIIEKNIRNYEEKNYEFSSYQLFSKNNNPADYGKLSNSVSEVTLLDIDFFELNKLMKEGSQLISLAIPYGNSKFDVLLYKQNILYDSFELTDQEGNNLDFTPGQYYRGIVEGEEGTLVGISFFENDIMGVISTPSEGNIIIGKSSDGKNFLTYAERNLLGSSQFSCGADELEFNKMQMESFKFDPEAASKTVAEEKCVGVHYEVSFRTYTIKNYNTTEIFNWVTGMHNNVSAIYENEDIDFGMRYIKIWQTQDPYTIGDSSLDFLYNFKDNIDEFEGDIAHLIHIMEVSDSSWAFTDILCWEGWNFSYTGLWGTYQEVPVYSWDIHAITHETGHNLGSPHTHACAWNGDDTAIDGCGTELGYEGCFGPLPTEGGTIMSYCHILPDIGVSFALGFGEQPGDLIRSRIANADCLGSDCSYLSVQDLTNTSDDGISIYPNPTDGIINVVSKDFKIQDYKLTDMSGRVIQQKASDLNLTQIDMSSLPAGVYILNIKNGNKEISKKIIKR